MSADLEQESFDVRTHNGRITVQNTATGQWRTFEVKARQFPDGELKRVVALLSGPEREDSSNWKGFGFATPEGVRVWRAQRGGVFDCYAKILNDPARGEQLGLVYLYSARCRRCNRPLTVPESIRSGIGPVCQGKEAEGE